jgi:hypothetical protein
MVFPNYINTLSDYTVSFLFKKKKFSIYKLRIQFSAQQMQDTPYANTIRTIKQTCFKPIYVQLAADNIRSF